MSQIVQAKCPHCANTLRIPADWVGKSLKCKYCSKSFQVKGKARAAVPAPVAQTAAATPAAKPPAPKPAMPAAAMPATAAPVRPVAVPTGAPQDFSFDEGEEDETIRPARRSRGGGLWVALLMLFLIGGVGAGGFFLYRHLNPVPDTGENPDLAQGEDGNLGKKKKSGTGRKQSGIANTGGLFPRRALLISVNNYLFFNSLEYGFDREAGYPGSSTAILAQQLSNPPMNVPATQVTELSDGAKKPHPVQKAVIESSITDFLDSCRAQDRIVLYFSGHATEIEKDAYLIPVEGRRNDPTTLIPLKWVYEQLAKCKARQKVFIVEAFHYSPSRGFELPGAGASDEGEMGEVFDEMLSNPPAGVQVWSACVKGQRSIEFDKGSIFMQALLGSLQKSTDGAGISTPTDPIPVGALLPKVNQKLKELLGGMKDMEQVSRLSGSEPESGTPYDPEEPLPAQLVLKEPPPPAEGAAGFAAVNSILNELKKLPKARATRAGEDRLLEAANLPPFPVKTIAEYKSEDAKGMDDAIAQFKQNPDEYAKKHPLRAAVLEAIAALDVSSKIIMRETLYGPINDKQKTAFLSEQKEPGRALFKLEEALDTMEAVAKKGEDDKSKRDDEKSKRWQAHFDFTMARLQARIVYVYEYNFILAQIRSDALPTLEAGQNGWRVGSAKKISVSEAKVKGMAKQMSKAWKAIQEEYENTPWAILAHREGLIALGLEWRAKAD